jgi:hypothetical protein
MRKLNLLSVFLTIGLLIGCGPSEETKEKSNEPIASQEYKADENQLEIEAQMAAIDDAIENDSLVENSSLLYYKEVADIEVYVYADPATEEAQKILESFTVAEGGSKQEIAYYMKGGKTIATRETILVPIADSMQYMERVSYYDDKEEVIISKQRTAYFEEELEYAQFMVGKKTKCSMDRAIRVLKQEGEFATHFQSFIDTQDGLYMMVGENKPDGYRATLLVNSFGGATDKLFKNPAAYKGKLLSLVFSKEIDEYFEFSLLHNASFVE